MGNTKSSYEKICDNKIESMTESISSMQQQVQRNSESIAGINIKQTEMDDKFNRLMEKMTQQQETSSAQFNSVIDRQRRKEQKVKARQELEEAKRDAKLSNLTEGNAKLLEMLIKLERGFKMQDKKMEGLQKMAEEIYYKNIILPGNVNQTKFFNQHDQRRQNLLMLNNIQDSANAN